MCGALLRKHVISSPHLNSSSKSIRRLGMFSSRYQPIVVIGVSLFLAVRLLSQISRYAVNIFYSDQWDFNDATLFQSHSLWEMFRWQHGPHRQGLGALFSKLLEPHFRWNSRVEAFLATAIVIAAAVCALYLKTRLWGCLSLSDIAIPLIFFTPAQYENLWVTPNFSHGPFPLLLVVLFCLALTCEHAATRYSLALAVNLLAIYTGFALFLGFITPLWLLLDYFLQRNASPRSNILVALGVSLFSLGSFFAGYAFTSSVDCFSLRPRSLVDYVVFVNLMLAHFVGARGSRFFVSIPLGGAILVAMMVVPLGFAKQLKRSKNYAVKELIPVILVTFCLIFCVSNAYGRTCMGRGAAFASRYTEYVEIGLLGLYLQALGMRSEWTRRIFSGLVVTALLVGSLAIPAADQYAMQYFHNVKANWRSCYIKIENIHQCDQLAGLGVFSFPERTKLKEKLDYLKRTKQNLYSDLN
jgi:hypothetical protein